MEWAYFWKVKQSDITKIKAISPWINSTVITDIPCRKRQSLDQLKNALLVFLVPQRLQITLRHWFIMTHRNRHLLPDDHSQEKNSSLVNTVYFMLNECNSDGRNGSFSGEWFILFRSKFYPASNRFHLLRNFMLPTLNSLWPLAFQKYSELSWALLWAFHHLDLSF